MTFDVAIIGAGIVGAACAMRLSDEGFSVAVIEANEPAGGTTAAGMGHIVVMDDSEAQFALTSFSQNLWNNLSEQFPGSIEFQNCGTIWIAADDDEMAEVRRKQKFFNARKIGAEILDEESLREAEPNLRPGLAGGLLVPGDSVVYQLCATRYFLEKAEENGAKIITGEKVFEFSDSGVKLSGGKTINSKIVINASGIGSSKLIERLKIIPKKGHLVITERYPNFLSHQLIELGYLKSAHSEDEDSVAFNIQPRATDQLLIGSSRQFGSNDKTIDHGILSKMLSRAFEYMPALRDITATRVWTGFRPATPDNLPYIGKCASFENVYIAAGHEGLGITTSLGTAELLTDEILGRESKIDRTVYSPERFQLSGSL
ncbi:MAG: FAD-binding oxidoreductase [Acidobacteria bacterium]|nr:FAD-binding oxidoreductase [Acidobacteriota bacterium]